MTPPKESRFQRYSFAVLALLLACTAATRADNFDIDRGVQFDSAAPPVDSVPELSNSAPTANPFATGQFPDVAAGPQGRPTEQELAGDSLFWFIVHHSTAHYPTTAGVVGSLARWRGGRPETICPFTSGLAPQYNAYVTARLRELAFRVGAPVQSNSHCRGNLQVLFTADPQRPMAEILGWAGRSLGVKYPHTQTGKLLAQSNMHAVQGWYITAGGGGGILNADPGLIGGLDLLPIWPLVIPTGVHGGASGFNGIMDVIVVVDTTKVGGYDIGSIADYIAMLAFSVVQSPDHCDPLPSILDLMSSSCGARDRPTAITAGDLAFLKALYYHNTGLGPSLSKV